LVVDFFETANPIYRLWSSWLPDGRLTSADDVVGFVAWILVVGVLAVVGWCSITPDRDVASSTNELKPMEEQSTCPPKQTVSVA
jgi:hypothetical protein